METKACLKSVAALPDSRHSFIHNAHLGVAAHGTVVAAAVDVAAHIGVATKDDAGVAVHGALVTATVDIAGAAFTLRADDAVAFDGEGDIAADGTKVFERHLGIKLIAS